MKHCPKCDTAKELDDFPKSGQSKDGKYTYCKECCRKRAITNLMTRPKRIPPAGMKWCGKCREDLPISSFWPLAGTYDGLAKRCKTCSHEAYEKWRTKDENKRRLNLHYAKYRQENRKQYYEYSLKQRYALEFGSYEKIFTAQNGACAICNKRYEAIFDKKWRPNLVVDHCHETNIVRGLLCTGCNTSIGVLRHDPNILQSAIDYLKKFQT